MSDHPLWCTHPDHSKHVACELFGCDKSCEPARNAEPGNGVLAETTIGAGDDALYSIDSTLWPHEDGSTDAGPDPHHVAEPEDRHFDTPAEFRDLLRRWRDYAAVTRTAAPAVAEAYERCELELRLHLGEPDPLFG